ncbi:MAG TPA: phospho-N-acetylmuramoyl-pentapeptide-transferase, partial [Gemmatimonadetes bacterium]|nr:phospho-N-acetylmuramoyl-pentapeptide-transferase [Gemmatimonadota bacterium]
MLAHLLPGLSELFGPFNVFVYISFRTAGAVVTSLVLAFLLGPVVIRRLKLMNVGQVVREIGPETHLAKSGTPTMGGVIIILATT